MKIGRALGRLHWTRGLRAGLAVAAAMLVCHSFSKSIGWATGWAALGGFEAILVDNGGPYRSRFYTIATLLLVGTVACLAGGAAGGMGERAVFPYSLPVELVSPVLITAGFCFLVTFARVIAQPVASTSVIILVIYFVALGSGTHSFSQSLGNALAFVLGGTWAAVLSLALWPLDPFRPAREAVAQCYLVLAEMTTGIAATQPSPEAREIARRRTFELHRQMRQRIESARAALAATAARAASRTVRAHNLTVLLESADMLFAGTIRMTELALGIDRHSASAAKADPLASLIATLSGSERSIAEALQRKPAKGEVACTLETVDAETIRRRAILDPKLAHLAPVELDALQNLDIAFEAVRAVWSGTDPRPGNSPARAAVNESLHLSRKTSGQSGHSSWIDSLGANWTLDSVMMRHALRMTVVGAADVVLLRVLHLSHGYWLGMTSIIVLQPYQSSTLKRGVERVGGTIAGAILAAGLAALLPSTGGIIAVVTVTSALTLATYAVDYAWYCFFLTPTFVLMGLPHLHDWQYAGLRVLTTFLGAAVAAMAMRLLWPEREQLNLGRLLARAAAADASYIRAVLRYWSRLDQEGRSSDRTLAIPASEVRRSAEAELLAPARRACGLASNDAEESLDRLMLESGFGRLATASRANGSGALASIEEHALTFVTYIRRFTQSLTTVAVVGGRHAASGRRLQDLALRLDRVHSALLNHPTSIATLTELAAPSGDDHDLAANQLRRMERQVSVLERAASGLRP